MYQPRGPYYDWLELACTLISNMAAKSLVSNPSLRIWDFMFWAQEQKLESESTFHPPPLPDIGNLDFCQFWTQEQKGVNNCPSTRHREFGILSVLKSGTKVGKWVNLPPLPPPDIGKLGFYQFWTQEQKVGKWVNNPHPLPDTLPSISIFIFHLKEGFLFLGGLSLRLNHLTAEHMSTPYWQFGTLPIGIFLSNLDSGQLETSLMTSYYHFWNLSTFGNSRAIWVFWPKLGVFRKSKFSRWRSNRASMWPGGFR